MRLSFAAVFVLGLLTVASRTRAQAPEVVLARGGPVTVEARWIEGTPRRAEVDLVRGEMRIRAFEGRTVRTAAAAATGDSGPEIVAVGYYHGGPQPFAGVALVDLGTGQHVDAAIPVAGAASPHRPAGLVITAEPGGFAIVMQEQQSDPSADVRTVFGRLGLDGRWITPPTAAAIPWGIAALAATPTGGYELAVLFGGWGSGQAGEARICLVALRADGTPTEHPWWASASVALTDVRLLAGTGGIDLYYRSPADEVLRHHFAAAGGWSVEPPRAESVARLRSGQGFYVRATATGSEARGL